MEEKNEKQKKGKAPSHTLKDKIAALEKKIKEKDEHIKELEDQLARMRSEFHNFRMALQREQEVLISREKENVVFKLIGLLEDFERALNHGNNTSENFVKGIRMLYKRLAMILTEEGVEEILPATGSPFDPFRDEAVETVESDSAEEMTILEVKEKGYRYANKILKAPKVVVAVKPRVRKEKHSDDTPSGQ
ncbi:hypothetical protein AT15_07965 [Kosmotoga arenicorallina S304]|uniref:Protein GrpE n=1 Tax=Kosmotoga arenicorallina S304 TaxID=1453497 RepID=A0A176K374_9BACT|nr:nucleotide exchange factor GrpE [Kosmotoga arenicorallina]OAA31422.1 hypothetical protein AT15_07965 [Kosmotoga arenicorallina S304]